MATELELMNLFITQGPFALLFVWLLYYTMKKNSERENRLTELLDRFSEKYDVIIDELRDIKNRFDDNEK